MESMMTKQRPDFSDLPAEQRVALSIIYQALVVDYKSHPCFRKDIEKWLRSKGFEVLYNSLSFNMPIAKFRKMFMEIVKKEVKDG